MRLLQIHHKLTPKQAGFTLIEMLVIAPLVLIVIAGLVGAMVSMIGDSLIASSRADAAYNIQDTLSQIEQDSRVATSFMGNFSYFSSPQGRNGGTAPFSYSSNNDLILTQQSTSSSPYNNTRQLIHYANQPASCSGDTSSNRTLFNRVVYFLITNGDGTKSLWRRTIMNPWNLNATPDGNTVCSAPWQRNSCPTGSTVNNTPGATCQSIDQKMLDNVTSFVPTFYTSSGATTSDPTKATTVSVSVTVSKTVSGDPISQTSVVRASKRNDVPATPIPNAPTVSIYNAGILSYNNPILTSFQWSSPGAFTYIISTKVGAGAWSTPKNTPDTNMSVSSEAYTTISIKVTAVNDSGTSSTTQYNTTSALFSDMSLEGDWVCHGGPFPCPSFTRTSAGVVMLRGLVKRGTGLITTLPPGFRPNKRLTLITQAAPDVEARIDILPTGAVQWISGGGNGWISLDSLRFLSSDFDSSLTWTDPVLKCPTGCTTPWHNDGGSYGKLQFTRDNVGRAHVYGLLRGTVPAPPPKYSAISNVPAGYQVAAAKGDIYPDLASSVYASYGLKANATLEYRSNGTGWKTFAAMYYTASTPGTWYNASLQNGWVNYGGSDYSTAGYTKATDNIVTLRGLIKSGTTDQLTTIFTLPAGYRPSKELLFTTAGYTSPSEVSVRIDVKPTGEVQILSATGTVGNTYQSLAGINFYQEQ